MKTLIYGILTTILAGACAAGDGKSAETDRKSDSLSLASERKRSDSLRKTNPLLIVPPDSNYTGSYVDKYPNGITKFSGFFRFGERHGQWVSFYPTGIPWSELHYDKGLRHGPNITYFENGKKRFEGYYKNDRQDSVWTYYDTTGKVAEQVLFKDSKIVKKLTK